MHAMLHLDADTDNPVIIMDQDGCIFKLGDVQKKYRGEPGHIPTQAKDRGFWFYGVWIQHVA
jgi:hypothetical protein